MKKKSYYIENKQDRTKILSTKNNYFNSPTGAFNSFISYYKSRKLYKEYFHGVPKGGIYSKESTENIRKIFDTYFEVKCIENDL